jgi:hypothetical protein
LRLGRPCHALRRLRASVADPGGAAPFWLLALAHPRRAAVNEDGHASAIGTTDQDQVRHRCANGRSGRVSPARAKTPHNGRPICGCRTSRNKVLPAHRGHQPGVDGQRPWSARHADDIRSFDPSRELSKETPYRAVSSRVEACLGDAPPVCAGRPQSLSRYAAETCSLSCPCASRPTSPVMLDPSSVPLVISSAGSRGSAA